MKSSQYIKVFIENADNLKKTNEHILFVIKELIYPGLLYRIRGLVLLCTGYEVNEQYEPVMYFFMLLKGNIKNVIQSKNITQTNLVLINNNENENNYKQLFRIYNT